MVRFPVAARGWLRFVLPLLIASASLPIAAAQAPNRPEAPSFTAESNLVLVPVVVTDRGGHIQGLQQGDFSLFDDGKPHKIVSFEEVKQVPASMKRVGAPGVFTNAVDATGGAHGVTIIVLDQVNTPFLDQSYARQELLKFLAEHISTNEPTALILIGRRGVRVVHDFTNDTRGLIAALKKVSSRSDTLTLDDSTTTALGPAGQQIVSQEVSMLDQFYAGTDGGYGKFQITAAIEITLNGLRHIAESMEGVPGRKSLIWATGGFPFSFTNNGELASLRYYTTGATHADVGALMGAAAAGTGDLPPMPESNNSTGDEVFESVRPYWQRTMQAMNRANISIYPVDARGLVAYSSAASSRVRMVDVYGTEAQTHTTMNDIAEVTGGKAYYNTNDIAGAFNKATNESSQYYMLGYYADKVTKTQWHKLQVKVDRPGVEIRSRTGYMAGVVTSKKPDDIKNSDIRSALASPLEYSALQLRVFLDPAQPGTTGKKKVPFEIDVVPGAATIDTADKNRVSMEFVAVARDPQGNPAGQFGQKVDVNLKPEQVAQFVSKGLNYNQALNLAPGSYQVIFIVRDNLSGKIGSVVAPLQVQ